MHDKTDQDENALVLSRNRSLAIKRSGLVKRGLEIIDKTKKRDVRVLIGDFPGMTFSRMLCEMLEAVIKDKYELKTKTACDGEELLKLAENGAFDVFIVTLNNIRFSHHPSFEEQLEKTLQLITQIKATYKISVIALSSEPKELAQAKLVADFLLPRPFKLDAFGETIAKCLVMLPEFEEIQRKGPIKGDG